MRGIAMAIVGATLIIGGLLHALDPKLKGLTDSQDFGLSAIKIGWFAATLIVIAGGW